MGLRKNIKLLFIVSFLFTSLACTIAQKQNNIWYFGTRAGLDFNFDPPKSISGNLVALEGTASISDPDGNNLFYSDGVTIWDRNKNIMPNGAGLVGGASSTQAALIVPLPNSCEKYYLFTTEDHYTNGGLAYSVVDMCLNNGMGDVVLSTKNTTVIDKTAEKITAVLHANGKDIWIISHTLNSDKFQTFLLTSAGLNTTPVISTIGSFYANDAIIGPVKASHDGTKIVSSASFRGICEMFDFNSSTGQLSNVRNLNPLFTVQQWVYGIEFSPNDSLLYLSTFYVTNYLYQVNLFTDQVTTLNSISGNYHYGALQMGPDKKIYMARNNSSFLDVIDHPDMSGTACGYREKGQLLSSGTSSLSGLPNFAPYSFFLNPNTLLFLGQDTSLCNGDSLIITLSSTTNCPVNYLWNDGTSTIKKVIKNTGTYWVEANYPCFILRDTIHIDAPAPPVISLPDTSICEGQKVNYDAFIAGASYLWSDNSTTPKIDISKQGHYWVQLSSSCYSVSDSFDVVVTPFPKVSFPDTNICHVDSLILDASFPGVVYLWSDGTTTPENVFNTAGSYWVQLENVCFTQRDTFQIAFAPVPTLFFNDTTICQGEVLTLDATFPGTQYLWSDNTVKAKHDFNHEGLYWIAISNTCYSYRDSFSIDIIRRPEVTFPDTSFCIGDTLLLNASFPDVTFLWSDGSTDSILSLVTAGSYWVQLSNACFSVKETINATSIASPDITLEDTVLCAGQSLILDATFPGASYLWSDRSTLPSLLIDHDGMYWVQVSNACGLKRETISVQKADCDFMIYMPNVFSPNNDNINETIKPFISTALSAYQFIIFDRWGDCVFISTDNQESWNGVYKNKKVPSGVFAYYLDCTSVLGIRKTLKGDITLIR